MTLHYNFSFIIIKSSQVKNSNAMELEGLRRGMDKLKAAGIQVKTLVTDRHPSVQKWMRMTYPKVEHLYDVWHIAKGKSISFPFCSAALVCKVSVGFTQVQQVAISSAALAVTIQITLCRNKLVGPCPIPMLFVHIYYVMFMYVRWYAHILTILDCDQWWWKFKHFEGGGDKKKLGLRGVTPLKIHQF